MGNEAKNRTEVKKPSLPTAYRMALGIWLFIGSTAFATPIVNLPVATNMIQLTNVVTLTNTVTLTNAVTQILPAQQTSGMTIIIGIISVLIALIVGGISLQQFFLAKEKFRLDLFEKRLAVYKAVDLFLYNVAITRASSNEHFQEFNRDTRIASFIFGDEIEIFINYIRGKAHDARMLKNDLDRMPDGKERKAKFKDYEAVQMELFEANQLLTVIFEPYLKFHTWKYGLIWPKKKKPIGLKLVDTALDTKSRNFKSLSLKKYQFYLKHLKMIFKRF